MASRPVVFVLGTQMPSTIQNASIIIQTENFTQEDISEMPVVFANDDTEYSISGLLKNDAALSSNPKISSQYLAPITLGTIAVPSTSITRPSISSSTVDKVSIPDTHNFRETPMQNPTTIIDQATASRTGSTSTECESPSVIDDVSNFLYEAAPREHLKTQETVRPPETEILLNLTLLSNLNMPSTSFATSEEIRPFPKAPPRLEDRRSVRKRKSTIYTDTPEKENLMEMKQKQKRKVTFKKTKSVEQFRRLKNN
ncbi:hypothetical protein HHI36_013372 [Cryptolaemus montrouzieri]|uniref:Uncharacterized protein n=1 Tax=Cryptolaemus montrouzieri TaxID=559131 RepID=A0ABD2NGX1_9CUCU